MEHIGMNPLTALQASQYSVMAPLAASASMRGNDFCRRFLYTGEFLGGFKMGSVCFLRELK